MSRLILQERMMRHEMIGRGYAVTRMMPTLLPWSGAGWIGSDWMLGLHGSHYGEECFHAYQKADAQHRNGSIVALWLWVVNQLPSNHTRLLVASVV